MRWLFYWGFPVVALIAIFSQVDLQILRHKLADTSPFWLLLALATSPLVIILGALRWDYLLRRCINRKISMSYSGRQYWMGLPLGMFVPGSLGWDAYRVLAVGQRYGHFTMNMGIIVLEKVMALVTCMLLIVLLYPFVAPYAQSSLLSQISAMAGTFLVTALLVLLSAVLLRHLHFMRTFLNRLESRLSGIFLSAIRRIRPDYNSEENLPVRHLVQPIASAEYFPPLLLYTLAIQVATAVVTQLNFLASGYDIPFLVNLFVTPVLFFIYLLPVSFGGLGVREASYIILYGMFGVPLETALLVSFLALAGLLVNNLIGGALVMIHRGQYIAPGRETGQ